VTTIRPLRWWDLEEVLAIEVQAFGASAWPAESFWGELARPDRVYLAAEDDHDRVCGYAGLWTLPPDADVQTIAVSGRVRGQGVGRALLRALIDEAGAQGCRNVHLEVRADNTAATALYERFGFAVVRRRERYYPDFSDALVMELGL
jgi:ribosomal-protein-alanine N-acetyltransferase